MFHWRLKYKTKYIFKKKEIAFFKGGLTGPRTSFTGLWADEKHRHFTKNIQELPFI